MNSLTTEMQLPTPSQPHTTDTPLSDITAGAETALAAASRLIHRSYLGNLNDYPVQAMGTTQMLDTAQTVRIFHIERLVTENRQSILESLTAIYTALGTAAHTAFLLIQADARDTHLYIGCRANAKGKGEAAGRLLQESFDGHFPGSRLQCLGDEKTCELLALGVAEEHRRYSSVTAVTSVPSLSAQEREHFSQGLERFLDAAQGRVYTALILGQPVSSEQLHRIRLGFESAATQISPLLKSQLSYGTQDSEAVGKSLTSGISTALGHSLSLTETTGITDTVLTSVSHSTSKSTDPSMLVGAIGMAATAGAIVAAPIALPVGLSLGAAAYLGGTATSAICSAVVGSHTEGETTTDSTSRATSTSHSEAHTDCTTVTESLSDARSVTRTSGNSQQITLDFSDKSIEQLLQKIDHHLERLDDSRAYGGWQVAAYFLGETTETSQSLGSLFLGLMRGNESGAEDFALTTWNAQQREQREHVLQWLSNLEHPRLEPDFTQALGVHQVTPAALLSGREMALALGLPRRSVAALSVLEAPAFGRSVRLLDLDQSAPRGTRPRLKLGVLRHLWRDTEMPLHLDLDKLCYHTLITGTTGVGKTTAIMSLLAQTHKQGVPFLVIEPAKGEYRRLMGLSKPGLEVIYRVAGRSGADALRINPMVFPEGIELSDHIDRLSSVFNAAFPLYAAMPQILEEALFSAYEELGWDSLTSTCVGGRRFPTLNRIVELIPQVVQQLGYSTDVSSDYVGALSARLRSLCRGSLGMTLLCAEHEETSDTQLFEGSAVVDLSPMGSPEKRALLMGILFMRLYEKRLAQGLPDDAGLRHLMVLEEAHVLLKRTTTDQSQDSSNPRGLAVEAFANALAEMRAYGQGFIVADQSASVLDDCVLRNTNTKIVMRAPFEEDRRVLGGALALDEKQTQQLAKLENQTALIHQSNWLEPVLCRIEQIPISELVPSADLQSRQALQRQAKTAILLHLWAERLPSGQNQHQQSPEQLEKLLPLLELAENRANRVASACQNTAPLTLAALSELADELLPALRDSSFRGMRLSLRAQWNRLHGLLSDGLSPIDIDVREALASDLLKALNRSRMSMRDLHLEIKHMKGIR